MVALVALLALLLLDRWYRKDASEAGGVSFDSLKGGEEIAIRSLATGKYLSLSPSSGKVLASAESAMAAVTRWRVLVLDTDTVSALLRSARSIDEHSEKFTGRKMLSASGCKCSGFSNAHGLGRFCHPWEDPMQEAWCYVSDNCSSASSRGSFGRRYEACDKPPEYHDQDDEYIQQQRSQYVDGPKSILVPASGCNCSGYTSKLGFGGHCSGWEYEGQTPWCYVARDCLYSPSRWARSDNGSFGQPFEECIWRNPEEASQASQQPYMRRRRLAQLPGRRLQAPSRISSLLASSPKLEKYVVLISMHSHSFLNVEAPPHTEALMLTAKSAELSIRSIFSSFEHTKLILAVSTNALLNLCAEESGEVCTGSRWRGERMKLLRMPRRTARWAVERVG